MNAHCLVPTTDEVEDSVPRERSQGPEPEYNGSADADSVPSTIEYPEIIRLIWSFWTTIRSVS